MYQGIRRGDVICIWSCNSYKWLQIQYAGSLIGAIICTVNPGYQGPELIYAIQKAKAKAIFLPGGLSSQNSINPFFKILTDPKVLAELKVKILINLCEFLHFFYLTLHSFIRPEVTCVVWSSWTNTTEVQLKVSTSATLTSCLQMTSLILKYWNKCKLTTRLLSCTHR